MCKKLARARVPQESARAPCAVGVAAASRCLATRGLMVPSAKGARAKARWAARSVGGPASLGAGARPRGELSVARWGLGRLGYLCTLQVTCAPEAQRQCLSRRLTAKHAVQRARARAGPRPHAALSAAQTTLHSRLLSWRLRA